MGELKNDFGTKSAEPAYCFDVGRRRFWKQISTDEWIELGEGALRRDLMKSGKSHKIDPAVGKISPLDDKIREIESMQRVMEARRIAGWHAGIHQMSGDAVLVPQALKLLVPVDGGEAGHLLFAALLEGLLDGDDEDEKDGKALVVRVDQRDRWLAWMQDWLRSLYSGRVTNGLAMCLAGKRDCGKSRLLAAEKVMAGDKIGKPYDWMIGREDFNKELFEASLLAIDDENANRTPAARQELGAKMKKIVANDDVRLRGMQSDGFVVKTTWRLRFNMNLEESALLVNPQLTDDIADKETMLKGYVRPRVPLEEAGMKAYRERYPALSAWWDAATARGVLTADELVRCWPMPMPADTQQEQQRFWGMVTAELPAFVFWLLEKYVPPSYVVGGRFRVRAWQHPEIESALQEFSPHVHLWRLIERSGMVWRRLVHPASVDNGPEKWEAREVWTGTARELHALLVDEGNGLSKREREHEVSGESYIGQRLSEAASHYGPEVASCKRSGKARTWTLRRSPEITG